MIGVRNQADDRAAGDRPPALGSRSDPGSITGPEAVTVAVTLQSGWSVPELGEAGEADGAVHDGASMEPGQDSVGATQLVARGATMAVIHGSTAPRTLAYRTATATGSADDAVSGRSDAVSGSADDAVSGRSDDSADDADRWSAWQTVSSQPDEGPDGLAGGEGHGTTAVAAGPIWLGPGVAEIEFVVVAGDTSSFDVTFLGSNDDRPDLTPAGAVVGRSAPQAVAPSIIRRDQWATGDWDYRKEACDGGPTLSDHTRAVVIHHTVTTNSYGESDVDDLLRAIYYSHVVVNGWCDIGYNFVVDRFGRIWEARTGSIDNPVIGGHARGFNTSTVGVALLGQHHPGARPSAAAPSSAAEAAVEALARWKLELSGIDPAGKTWLRNRSTRQPLRLAGDTWHHLPTVLSHRDLGVTSCPGGHSMDLVRGLPARLAAARDLTLPYSFVDWRSHSHGPGFMIADRIGGIRPAGAATPWPQAPAGLDGDTAAIAVGGNLTGGYLLSRAGDLIGFGSAPEIADRPAGEAAVVDLVVRTDGQSGWVLDQSGFLHGFGGGTGDASGPAGAGAVAAAVDDTGAGYILSADGLLSPVGGAPPASIAGALGAGAIAVDLDIRPEGGGWVLDDRGRIHGFGGAQSAAVGPPAAVKALTAATAGPGGWVLDADGQLWPFGGARLIFPVSTNATAGHAVDVDNAGAVYSPAFVNSGDARFVTSVYQLFLGRDPSVVEVDLAVTDLEQGDKRRDLTTVLSRSEHWSGSTVDEMYRNSLGREPDPGGRAYWLGEIAAGLRLSELGIYFYGSPEYANAAGSVEAYVTGLYSVLLHRAPDADGLRYWAGLLERGEARPPDVAAGFYASIESRRDRADALHRKILGGPASAEQRERWAERLQVVGDADVAAEMAASREYYQLVVDGPEP